MADALSCIAPMMVILQTYSSMICAWMNNRPLQTITDPISGPSFDFTFHVWPWAWQKVLRNWSWNVGRIRNPFLLRSTSSESHDLGLGSAAKNTAWTWATKALNGFIPDFNAPHQHQIVHPWHQQHQQAQYPSYPYQYPVQPYMMSIHPPQLPIFPFQPQLLLPQYLEPLDVADLYLNSIASIQNQTGQQHLWPNSVQIKPESPGTNNDVQAFKIKAAIKLKTKCQPLKIINHWWSTTTEVRVCLRVLFVNKAFQKYLSVVMFNLWICLDKGNL